MDENTPILFFDGECGLCSNSVRLVAVMDCKKRIKFAPLQGKTATKLLSASDRENPQTLIFLDSANTRHYYTDALVSVMHEMGGLNRVLSKGLRKLPQNFRDKFYKYVARNRFKIFGKASPKAKQRIESIKGRTLA